MKVIIIGAGLAGVATALACRREGIEVDVFERAPKILPVRTFHSWQRLQGD